MGRRGSPCSDGLAGLEGLIARQLAPGRQVGAGFDGGLGSTQASLQGWWRGWGGAHGAQTEPDARLGAFYHHSFPLCLILSLRTSREVQAMFKDRKKDWDSPLGGRRVKIFQAFFFFLKRIKIYVSGRLGS